MRISDWSSDVCSSDLPIDGIMPTEVDRPDIDQRGETPADRPRQPDAREGERIQHGDGVVDRRHRRDAQPKGMMAAGMRLPRSEERRVGKEGGSTGSSRWSPYH